MQLNDRKIKILEAIIRDYIATAEPIGSRTIAKKFDLGVSSATIRNEMSDLEEMGLIVQPHLSSGRVPSNKGYRYYVDSLMQHQELNEDQLDYLFRIVAGNLNSLDYLMKETAKAISILTNYTTIISEPHIVRTRIKHLQLVPVDESSALIVLVTDSKVIKQSVISFERRLSPEEFFAASNVLTQNLAGLMVSDLDDKYCMEIKNKLGKMSFVFDAVLDAVIKNLVDESNIEVYTSGVKNLLTFPEFSDLDKARALFNALDERQTLISLISGGIGETVQIVIGDENTVANLQDCSIIKANYTLGGQTYGNIGIIGPIRMDYPKVVSVLRNIVSNIERLIGDGYNKSD